MCLACVRRCDRISQVALTAQGTWIEAAGWKFDQLPAGTRALFACVPTVNKAAVAAQLREIGDDVDARDEATVLNDWVKLNGEEVISKAQLPGIPPEGPIALQHHGGMRNGKWTGPPSLVQFRNIMVKELR